MKRKIDGSPFGVLFSLYIERVQGIAAEMGYQLRDNAMQVAIRAKVQLRDAIESPEVTAALALSMTSLVTSISLSQVDKPDSLIARYAVEFAIENRLQIAEVILTGGRQEGSRVY